MRVTNIDRLAAQLCRRHQHHHVLPHQRHVDANPGVEFADEIGPLNELALGLMRKLGRFAKGIGRAGAVMPSLGRS